MSFSRIALVVLVALGSALGVFACSANRPLDPPVTDATVPVDPCADCEFALDDAGADDGQAASDADVDPAEAGDAATIDAGPEASGPTDGGERRQRVERCFVAEPTSPPCVGAWCRNIACVHECATDVDCTPGHRCVLNEGRRLCSPFCDPTACGGPAICTRTCGGCFMTACARDEDCPNGGICYRDKGTCFPRTGECSETRQCPPFGELLSAPPPLSCALPSSIERYGTVSCDLARGRCRFAQTVRQLPPNTKLETTDAVRTIVVRKPESDTPFRSQDEIEFQWDAVDSPVIALILTDVSPSRDQLLEHAIWGYAASAGFSRPVRLSMGKAIVGREWRDLRDAPLTLAPDKTYYLFVQGFEPGAVVAESAVVPFVFGSTWKHLDDACADDDSESYPDSCDNPMARPQVCFRHRCWRVCASDDDCRPGEVCSGTVAKSGRIRLCGY